MYINKLHLKAFGKFLQKKINLEKGFNIIYGENEAGKSTIHNFIEAILYGFDEDGIDVARYQKYKPWKGNIYKGTMSLKGNNDEDYMVSKDFLLGTCQLIKKNPNEPEIQEQEISCPGEHLFKMNKISYNNTVSVRQLGNKTDKELAIELKNKIINLSKTRDESISVDRIIQRLNNIKEEVGDINNHKTLLGQYSLRLSELKTARENSIKANRQVMFLAMEKKRLGSKIQEIDMRIEELKKELHEYELSVDKDKFLRAEPVKEELDEILEKLSQFKEEDIKEFSENDYKEASKIEKELELMYGQRHDLSKEKEDKEAELESYLSDISNRILDDFNIDDLNSNYKMFESNNKKINELIEKIAKGKESIKSININYINAFIDNFNKVEEINRKIEILNLHLDNANYDKIKKFGKSQRIKNIVSSLVGTVFVIGASYSCYMAYMNNIMEYYYGAGAFIPAIILYVISFKFNNRYKSAKNEIDSMECEYADYTISLEQLKREREEIILETGCKTLDEVLEKYNKLSKEKSLYEEKNKLISYDLESLGSLEKQNIELKNNILQSLSFLDIDEICEETIKKANDAYLRKDLVKEEIIKLKGRIEQLHQRMIKLDKEIEFEEKRFNMILNSNGMSDLDEFEKAIDYKHRYVELLNNKVYKETVLNKILGDSDYDELKERTKNVPLFEIKKLDKQEHQIKIFKLSEEKSKIIENIDHIIKEIEDIENNTRSLVEVEEEIDFYENKIGTFKRRIEVAEIASDKILKISDSIKGDFMPLLKKSISDNFSYLTGGKYCEVVIDENMNITVIEEDNKERNVDLENLSGGTLDQLYLSLRIGLSNILSGNKNIPLIFDDSFVQYDSKRLKNSIEMLFKESERRQIILFTCQEREAEIAEQMNVKFNFIKL